MSWVTTTKEVTVTAVSCSSAVLNALADAQGFIRLNSLRLRAHGALLEKVASTEPKRLSQEQVTANVPAFCARRQRLVAVYHAQAGWHEAMRQWRGGGGDFPDLSTLLGSSFAEQKSLRQHRGKAIAVIVNAQYLALRASFL